MTAQETSQNGVEHRRSQNAYAAFIRLFATLCCDALVMVGCGNGVKPTATTTVADTADQVLVNMTHELTVDGIRRARVRADTAYFFQQTQTAELRSVHVTFFGNGGTETSEMTAREGTYHWITGDMEGRGNVVVVGKSDGRTLRSEVMRYKALKNEVSSDQAFVFDAPGRHVEGEGFVSDPNFTDVTAQHPHGTGGKFSLPNQ